MSQHHSHNTRSTPEKPPRGGRRPGAGRPEKENIHPNSAANLPLSSALRNAEKKEREEYEQQSQQLANRKGRSWSYDECMLIIMLVIGIL